MKHVTIYTDGACRGNPGPGGWAALLQCQGKEKELLGAEANTTNNRMELMGAISALTALREHCLVDLYTDSQYVQKGISEWLPGWERRGWKRADKKPIKNVDLWQQLAALAQKHTVRWHWVRGHSGHVENERVDQLANDAIDTLL